VTEDRDYYITTRDNLLRDTADPRIVDTVPHEVTEMAVERVLDMGCGIGQALFPLAVKQDAAGIGVDVSDLSLAMGRKFYAEHFPHAAVGFIKARAEKLPFSSASFDVVNCGLALPYTNNSQALAEVSRVLRSGGVFLLKIHHARYYIRELRNGISKADLMTTAHGGRVLAAGSIYHLTRRQPRSKILNETYQTRWLLKRELTRFGMSIERELQNINPMAPAFIIRRH
jgi:ubiquinone/menaquinone biosynthesis C-methylase UbiE